MMEKPEWFMCEFCLWWEKGDTREICIVATRNLGFEMRPRNDYYCNEWTCRRCWQAWDAEDFADDYETRQFWFVDHSWCKPARIGE